VKVLGEIPAQGSPPLRAGTLRRDDLEAFGAILRQLDGVRGVLVTGEAGPKRAAAVGLAAAAAATGTHTALVECDLGDPALAEALGLAGAPGLTEYLRGEADVARILESVALAGPGSAAAREPLACVVAGSSAAAPAALLGSPAFRHAIEKLRAAYELVVVEGAAVPSEDGALATVAAQLDATLLCAGRLNPIPELSLPVSGLVLQG
jgi:polysaccharide biosynthesis transport protein